MVTLIIFLMYLELDFVLYDLGNHWFINFGELNLRPRIFSF